MSRTYRKDRITEKYTLEAYINRQIRRYKYFEVIYISSGMKAIWLAKYQMAEDEIRKNAIEEYARHSRDGQGWVHLMRELAIEGKVCGWRDAPKSMKKKTKRIARRQQKEETRKLMKEYGL